MRVQLSFPFLEFYYVNRISKLLVADFLIGFAHLFGSVPVAHYCLNDFMGHVPTPAIRHKRMLQVMKCWLRVQTKFSYCVYPGFTDCVFIKSFALIQEICVVPESPYS